MDSITGTYYGVLPPDIKTTLTLNANGTYRLKQKSANDSDSCEVLNGIFQVLDYNILMLVHPSSGDNIFYKMKNYSSIILIDSSKNEPKRKEAKHFVLRKNAKGTVQFRGNAIRFHGIVLLLFYRISIISYLFFL